MTAVPPATAITPAAGPMVGVLLTVYQRTDYLRVALQSALTQSVQDLEILVLDDSASLTVRQITEEATSHRVRYLPSKERLGVARSVRRGLEATRAPYVAVLNDDDAWEPDFLATLLPALEADRRRVLAFCDHWIMDPQGQIDVTASDANTRAFGRDTLPAGDVANPARFAVITNGVPMAMGCVFRRTALDASELVAEVGGAYDYWMTCLLVAGGGRIYYAPQRLTRYRVHPEMESRRQGRDGRELVFITAELRRRSLFPALRRQIGRAHAATLAHHGHRLLIGGRPWAACRALIRSLLLRPSARAAAAVALCALPQRFRGPVIASLGHSRLGQTVVSATQDADSAWGVGP